MVHFNTPMSVNHPTGFPDDLQNAMTLTGCPISFSTIQVKDRGPWQGGHPADANAGGSVGVVVDIKDVGSVNTVDPNDSGSSAHGGSGGHSPDCQACNESISKRKTANEWWVQDYIPLGVFVFLPARVFVKTPTCQGERDAGLSEILAAFPNDRIYSVLNGSFVEYDRQAAQWNSIGYADIVPA